MNPSWHYAIGCFAQLVSFWQTNLVETVVVVSVHHHDEPSWLAQLFSEVGHVCRVATKVLKYRYLLVLHVYHLVQGRSSS